jgi:hypothetical protein
MKQTKHTPILLGTNDEDRRQYEQLAKQKVKLFADAKAYCEQFIDVTDLQTFSESFSAYLIEALRPTKNNTLEPSQIAELNGVNLRIIKFIEKSYKAIHVPLNADFASFTTPDFNTYTTNQAQNHAYKVALDTIEQLKKAQEVAPVINLLQIRRFLPFITLNSVSELTPCPLYIQTIS